MRGRLLLLVFMFGCFSVALAQPGKALFLEMLESMRDPDIPGYQFIRAPVDDIAVQSYHVRDFRAWVDTTVTLVPLEKGASTEEYVEMLLKEHRRAATNVCAVLRFMEPVLTSKLDQHLLPRALKVLPAVLSASNPHAYQRQAAGIWALHFPQARQAGLKITPEIDERFEIDRATGAATSIMKELLLGDITYPEMFRVFSCGPAYPFIRDSVLYNWCFDLPAQFTAWLYVYENRQRFGLATRQMIPVPFDVVVPMKNLLFENISSAISVSVDDIKALNPALVTDEAIQGYNLYLPPRAVQKFAEAEADLYAPPPPPPPPIAVVYYTVRSGDTLSEIAERFHVRVSSIREWNNLRSMTIYAGQQLIIQQSK